MYLALGNLHEPDERGSPENPICSICAATDLQSAHTAAVYLLNASEKEPSGAEKCAIQTATCPCSEKSKNQLRHYWMDENKLLCA